jgi:hypothetical protein
LKAARAIGAIASRAQGIGARLKYSALPLPPRTSFTQFGSKSSSIDWIGVARVAIGAELAASACATAWMPLTGACGSSPCKLTTSGLPATPPGANSARSVPGGSARVITSAVAIQRSAVRASWRPLAAALAYAHDHGNADDLTVACRTGTLINGAGTATTKSGRFDMGTSRLNTEQKSIRL